MRYTRHHPTLLLVFALLRSSSAWAESTTRPADRPEILQIDQWVSDIDHLPVKSKITDVIFDSCEGSSLTWFTHQKQRPKVSWLVGTSSYVQIADFYFRNGKLIQICLKKMDYPKNSDGTPIHDMNRLTIAARTWIYSRNDTQILMIAEPGMTKITEVFFNTGPIRLASILLRHWGKENLDLNALSESAARE